MRANKIIKRIKAPITNIRNGISNMVSGKGFMFGIANVLTDTFTVVYYYDEGLLLI
jgi:hypothetical protein